MRKNAIIRIVLFSVIAILLIGLLVAGIVFSRIPFRYFDEHRDRYVQNIDGDDPDHGFFGGDGWGNHIFGDHDWDDHVSDDHDWDDRIFGDHDWDDRMTGGNVSSTGSVNASQVSELEIQWVAGSITIVPGDTEQIEFSGTPDAEWPMVWKQVGNKLMIQFCEDHVHSPFGKNHHDYSKDLVVTVPKSWTPREVQIDAVSANVDVSDLTMTEVEVSSASGICEFRNCVADSFSVDTMSGNITFSGSIGELECNAASADCTIVASQVPRGISMESMSGDIDLTLPETAGFTVEMENLKGDLNTDFAVTKRGRIYTYGDGSCQIEMSALSGNVTIHKLVP